MKTSSVNDMPEHLRERIRILGDATTAERGDYILYWMHHALRAHENPALDVALEAGSQMHLPVLVYQGLSGAHPYNSDRHHTFILEGSRDVARDLLARDIRHVFYLAQDPTSTSPLRSFMRRARLVVTEDFPVPPFTDWTQKLCQDLNKALWAVDTHCVIPMQSHGRAYDRAFQLRQRCQADYERRLLREWPETTVEALSFQGDLGFSPLDLEQMDIADCCARCDIDHSVGPVPHTRGGSRAGYERWESFKWQGLAVYARLRNDPNVRWPQAVSRLSPYLHYGMVSPFRIAREAAQFGAEKFLDELLIWRELAFNFCSHHPQLKVPEVLPDWASETLAAHECDPREVCYSWERLARAHTGDPLWDAAQQSLLIHGELHNNLRMTWGKALLRWTHSAAEAFRLLVDLNHRYALDGSDPNSYGGILWCLGLFDRPFKPTAPIYGTVRTRSTEEHASRIDLDAYRVRVGRSARQAPLRLAVVGAGLAGLSAARTVADHGWEVEVFEKSRGTGGRLATRRIDDLAFDIGAQYFTVRDPRFRRWVDAWQQDGLVQAWQGRIQVLKRSTSSAPITRYVGVPRMTAISRHLTQDLSVHFQTRVTRLVREGKGWQIETEGEKSANPYHAIILAVPPVQAAALLEDAPDIQTQTASVDTNPCWTVMAGFDRPLPLPYDGLFANSPILDWAARNSSKPGRPAFESWVLHASTDWSTTHLEWDAPDIRVTLLRAFFDVTGLDPLPAQRLEAHRWRYARTLAPLTSGCLWDADRRLAVCGDWCHGARVEGAVLSGMAAAGRLLGLPDEA